MVKNVAYITLLWIYNMEETKPLNLIVPGKTRLFLELLLSQHCVCDAFQMDKP